MTIAGFTAMTEPAKVFEDRDGQWGVEWFDDDGRCELKIFNGSDAHRQALRYVMQKYGHFEEVQSLGEIALPR
jgi:hypothetical protein